MSNSSIWLIDRTLSDATTLRQSGPGSNSNEGIIYISQSSSITGISPSDYLASYLGHLLQLVYSSVPANWAGPIMGMCVCVYIYIYTHTHRHTPTPHEQDVMQNLQVWIQSFPSPNLVAIPNFKELYIYEMHKIFWIKKGIILLWHSRFDFFV